jgi:hypothetical protein
MEPYSLSGTSPIAISQRELLGLILGCAVRGSASFTQALQAAAAATRATGSRTLTRELLSDLAIRDWIEFRIERPGGGEVAIERLRYELELTADRNWDERSTAPRVRYALTGKGRVLLGTLVDRP